MKPRTGRLAFLTFALLLASVWALLLPVVLRSE
jgi:hypothetical protein